MFDNRGRYEKGERSRPTPMRCPAGALLCSDGGWCVGSYIHTCRHGNGDLSVEPEIPTLCNYKTLRTTKNIVK